MLPSPVRLEQLRKENACKQFTVPQQVDNRHTQIFLEADRSIIKTTHTSPLYLGEAAGINDHGVGRGHPH